MYTGATSTFIDLTLNLATGDLTVQGTVNVPNSQDGVTPIPALTELIEGFERFQALNANAVVGAVTADITKEQNEVEESAPGGVLADAHLAATSNPDTGCVVVAFMNPGGIHDNITFAPSGPEANGDLPTGKPSRYTLGRRSGPMSG